MAVARSRRAVYSDSDYDSPAGHSCDDDDDVSDYSYSPAAASDLPDASFSASSRYSLGSESMQSTARGQGRGRGGRASNGSAVSSGAAPSQGRSRIAQRKRFVASDDDDDDDDDDLDLDDEDDEDDDESVVMSDSDSDDGTRSRTRKKSNGTSKSRGKTSAAAAPAAPRKRTLAQMSSSGSLDASADEEDGDFNSPRPRSASSSVQRTSAAAAPRRAASTSYSEAKTIEEIYQKKTQLEHVLLRPDTYIGSVQPITLPMWVMTPEDTIVHRQITYVPGFYKIFDEILVNAADNKIRDPKMDTLKVTIDPKRNMISVLNNGKGIPVVVHKEEGVYVPELIFGHLLTSSNYDDNERKITGGRNGYGAKLCNIFSTHFIVETADRKTKKVFKQEFSANMSQKNEPVITPNHNNEEYTKITFRPDLDRLNMAALDDDIVALLRKRVYDMAACLPKVRVYLNNEPTDVNNFKSYVAKYIGDNHVAHHRFSDRWEIAVSTSNDGQFSHMSFVNSICTPKGGTHVDYIANQVVSKLQDVLAKKHKNTTLKPFQIRNQLWIFVNCSIENPTFDSQTKEQLTLRASAFGSDCKLTDDFLAKFIKNSPVIDLLASLAESKHTKLLQKSDGRKVNRISGIPKLDDANNAGTRLGSRCTLILTEGDSAKTFAVNGLSVVGRQDYGVFPLRGKLLNVREAHAKATAENTEIEQITKILGLQHKKVYENTDALRYGHVMIMTDQDHDGSHIKGLLLNFFDHFWPSLLKLPGFMCEFITPIVKCRKGNQVVSFFTVPEYENWREENNTKGWEIKYYKGLGTSDSKEAKEYFSDLPRHKKEFEPCDQEDQSCIDLAFNKKKADMRKHWLSNYEPGTFIDNSKQTIPVKEFINKELILFSMADNVRSIPSVVDGFKPGHRKVLFSCVNMKLKSGVKVLQLAGAVAGRSAYHHGEMSLCDTIIGMAQDFVGANNINLLEPLGMFGSRLKGGKDAASPRYPFTKLAPITRCIFPEHDDPLLKYLNDDGLDIEPEWYIPIIPMILVNGAHGIGTGWSTSIPCFNPTDIINNIRRMLMGKSPEPMVPWYRGFTGTIERAGASNFTVRGVIEKTDDTHLRVLELPVGYWTDNYKQFLEDALDKNKNLIQSYRAYHTAFTVDFELQLTPEQMRIAEAEGLEKRFNLISSISTSNMVCFNEHGKIQKYSSADEIFQTFFILRKRFYSLRKAHLEEIMLQRFKKIDAQRRFIQEVVLRTLIIERKKKIGIVAELRQKDYPEFNADADSKKKSQPEDDSSDAEGDDNEKKGVEVGGTKGYDYLLNMPLYSLTEERLSKLENEMLTIKSALDKLVKTTPEQMWVSDLEALEKVLHQSEADRISRQEAELNFGKKANQRSRAATVRRKPSASQSIAAPLQQPKLQTVPTKQAPSLMSRQNSAASDDFKAFSSNEASSSSKPSAFSMLKSKPEMVSPAKRTKLDSKPKPTANEMSSKQIAAPFAASANANRQASNSGAKNAFSMLGGGSQSSSAARESATVSLPSSRRIFDLSEDDSDDDLATRLARMRQSMQ